MGDGGCGWTKDASLAAGAIGLYEGESLARVAGRDFEQVEHSEEEAEKIEEAKRAKRIIYWLTVVLVAAPVVAFLWVTLSG